MAGWIQSVGIWVALSCCESLWRTESDELWSTPRDACRQSCSTYVCDSPLGERALQEQQGESSMAHDSKNAIALQVLLLLLLLSGFPSMWKFTLSAVDDRRPFGRAQKLQPAVPDVRRCTRQHTPRNSVNQGFKTAISFNGRRHKSCQALFRVASCTDATCRS